MGIVRLLVRWCRHLPGVPGLRAAALFALTGMTVPCAAHAQQPENPLRDRFMEDIDPEEGERKLRAFRNQRLDGDYFFRFELEHLPRRARKSEYRGRMWGSWDESGPLTRIRVWPGAEQTGDDRAPESWILRGGASLEAWHRQAKDGEFRKLEGDALFEPVFEGVLHTPFDLLMPFTHWEDSTYEGPARVRSRIVQEFRMRAPEGGRAEAAGIHAVRIGLDDAYDALLRAEVLDAEGNVVSRFAVESFKKVGGRYIVKQITLEDAESGDRTRFSVQAAAVGLDLPRALFDAASPADAEPPPDDVIESL